MAHLVELDRLQAKAKHRERDCTRAESGSARSVTIGEGLRDKIGALIPRLTRYARALTRDEAAAEDLVQDCLERVLTKIDLWQPGTDLRAWMFTILHNQYINRLRRDARHRAAIELQKPYRALAFLPDQNVKLELRDVERALAKLPEDQRSLIVTIGVEGISYEDAASEFDLPLGTVRSRVGRARLRLRFLTDHVLSQVQSNPTRFTNQLPVGVGAKGFPTHQSRAS